MRYKMDWTPARIEELITLWRQGLTSYQLAKHFGVTRNSIMGKVHRLKRERGLMREQPIPLRVRRKTVSPDTIQKRSYTRRDAMLSLASRADSMLRIVTPPPAMPNQGQLASIVDVTGCRWPVKDDPEFIGGFAFCNHAQRDGSAYCEYHARTNVAPWSADAKRRTQATINYILKRVAA